MDKNMVKEEGKNIETFIKYFIEEATMGITILTKEDINLLIDKIYFELNKCIGRKGLVDYWIDTKSIDNPKLKIKLGKNGRKMAETKFSIKERNQRLKNIFDEVLK